MTRLLLKGGAEQPAEFRGQSPSRGSRRLRSSSAATSSSGQQRSCASGRKSLPASSSTRRPRRRCGPGSRSRSQPTRAYLSHLLNPAPNDAFRTDARTWYSGSKRRPRPRRWRSEEKSPRRIATSAPTSSGVRTASSSESHRGTLRSCEYSSAAPKALDSNADPAFFWPVPVLRRDQFCNRSWREMQLSSRPGAPVETLLPLKYVPASARLCQKLTPCLFPSTPQRDVAAHAHDRRGNHAGGGSPRRCSFRGPRRPERCAEGYGGFDCSRSR